MARLDCSNKFPELTCAYYFYSYLKKKGIMCLDGPADMKAEPIADPAALEDINIIGTTYSPTLDRVAFETNHASNNVYAETLLRTLGKELLDNASYESSYVALAEILKNLGVDTSTGAQIQDGSGLSRQNYVSADFFCRFLSAMAESPAYDTYLRSLPSPGSNGTLVNNMQGQSASLRNRIKVKSGSMNGVRCYSGYIIPSEGCKDETIVFSIMVNNCTAPSWKVRPLMDKIMGLLAQEN